MTPAPNAVPSREGSVADAERKAGAAGAGQGGLPRRVAIVSGTDPYAVPSGSAAYLSHLAASLAALGAQVHLLVLAPLTPTQLRVRIDPRDLAPYAGVEIRGTVQRGAHFYASDPRHWLRRPFVKPAQRRSQPAWTLPEPDVATLTWAGRRLASLAPDLVVANYFNAAAVFTGLPPRTVTAILVHDVMALRARGLATAGLVPDFDTGMIAREAAAFARAGLCLAIKEEEAAYIRALVPGARATTFPFAVVAPAVDLDAPRPPYALFVGSLARPNVDALAWLASEIWPRVRAARPDARLRVAGRVAETHPDPVGAATAGIDLLGVVPDLAVEYARAAIALTPLRFGSGLKIKLIEGLAHGVPSVATPVGADGVRPAPEHILRVAADAESYADAVLTILSMADPAAARHEARAFAAAHYAPEVVRDHLAAELATLAPSQRAD